MDQTPRVRYLLCTVPRCGSSYLCHLLGRTRRLGMRANAEGNREHLLWIRAGLRPVDWSRETPASLLEAAFAASASPDGSQGFKMMWADLELLLGRFGGSAAGQRRRRRFEAELASTTRFVSLRRRDLLRQAVSWSKALQSDGFRLESEERYRGRFRYSYLALVRRQEALRGQLAAWRSFFERNGIEPLELVYEDYLRDPETAVRSVAAAVGVEVAPLPSLDGGPLQVQSNAVNEEWTRRFRRDDRSALSRGWALLRSLVSPAAASWLARAVAIRVRRLRSEVETRLRRAAGDRP